MNTSFRKTHFINVILALFLLTVSLPYFAQPLSDNRSSDIEISSKNSKSEEALSYLNKMQHAVLKTNYRIYFYTIENLITLTSSNTFQYQHSYNEQNDREIANLISLDGLPREIILNDNTVSYFQADATPFALKSKYILEAFPEVVYADYNDLAKHYNYVLLGKARVANKLTQLVRISPKNDDKYSYLFWIDDENYLPLRIDLLDEDSMTIKQFKVINVEEIANPDEFANYLDHLVYPMLLPTEKRNSDNNEWTLNWLPDGFKKSVSYNLFFEQSGIETELYKDGIFAFTISVSDDNSANSEIEIESSTSIFSKNIDGKNIIIIGDLPLPILKKIVNNIDFK